MVEDSADGALAFFEQFSSAGDGVKQLPVRGSDRKITGQRNSERKLRERKLRVGKLREGKVGEEDMGGGEMQYNRPVPLRRSWR